MGKSKSIEPISIPILNSNGQTNPETKSGLKRATTNVGISMEKRDPIKPRSNSNKFTNNQETLIISTWNIRRGLIVREIELKNMLNDEKIDIMFVTETDTKTLENEKSYQVEGYNTIFPQRKNADSKVRIICLAKINLYARIKIRRDLMSGDFPSIWLELSNGIHKSLLIAGFYRQWSHENLSKNKAEQNGVIILLFFYYGSCSI